MTGYKFQEIEYKPFGRCLQIDNGLIDIVVTLDIGPRVIRMGALNQKNVFCDDAPLTITRGNDEWRLCGGHRLWHSPEAFPRTYDPDNYPVEWKQTACGIHVKQPLDELGPNRKRDNHHPCSGDKKSNRRTYLDQSECLAGRVGGLGSIGNGSRGKGDYSDAPASDSFFGR